MISLSLGNNPTILQTLQEHLTIQTLLDIVVTLGDHPEVQKDNVLLTLFQNKADELFRLSGSEGLSSENQTFFRMVQQLLSEGNKINTFVRKRLLENAGSSSSLFPQSAMTHSPSPLMTISNVNAQEIGCNGEVLLPLAVAARSGDVNAIQRLISEGAQVNGKCTAYLSREEYYLYRITCDPSIKERKELAPTGKLIGEWTPLKFAVHARQLEAALELIKHQADVNAIDEKDHTILMLAAAMGWAEMVEILIKNGAKVNAKGLNITYTSPWATGYGPEGTSSGVPKILSLEWTALHAAARLHHLEAAMILLENEADVNAATFYGHVPLMYALGNVQLFKELIVRDADVHRFDRIECNDSFNHPIHCKGVLTLLEYSKGILTPMHNNLNNSEETFWKRGEKDRWSRYRMDTVLHHAVRGNYLVEAQLIMSKIKDIEIYDLHLKREIPVKALGVGGYRYTTPLELATYKALASSEEEQDRAIAMMKLLLYHGADVETEVTRYPSVYLGDIQKHPEWIAHDVANARRTLLMSAAVAGALKVMRVLLDHGASVHLKTYDLRLSTPEDKMFLRYGPMDHRMGEYPAKVVKFETNIFSLASKYAPIEVREEVKQLLLSFGASTQAPDYKAIPCSEYGKPTIHSSCSLM